MYTGLIGRLAGTDSVRPSARTKMQWLPPLWRQLMLRDRATACRSPSDQSSGDRRIASRSFTAVFTGG